MGRNVSKSMKILSIILGTLAGGFLWRCRGESGWGSSWGLYSVGLILLLLIYQFYGKRSNMKYENICIGAALTGLGVTGYATVIEQLAGVVYSDLPYAGGDPVYSPVDPYSGLIIILIMGFTLVPFFSFFVGTLFSGKKYKIQHYIIAIAIFFAVSYIAKATVSHYILKAINPDQVNYAALGLKDYGFDYASPMQAYMKHFGNRRWTQEIPYFENYYMSIEHISDAFGVIAVALYPLIAFKDKVSCGVTLFISTFTAIATTALSSLISIAFASGFFAGMEVPRALQYGAGWGIWEFSTGASVGFFTMLIIALLPKKYTEQTMPDESPLLQNKKLSFLFNIVATVFIFGVVPFRVLGIRFGKLLENLEIFDGGETVGTILMIVASVIFGILMIIKIKKNMESDKPSALGLNAYEFSFKAFPAYIIMCCLAYFCLNHGYIFFFPYSALSEGISKFAYEMTGPEHFTETLMIIAFAVFAVIYFPTRKKLKKA